MYKDTLIKVEAKLLVSKFTFVAEVIYKVKNLDFKYVLATMTGDFQVVDCFPCDRKGRILKGYEYPIPVDKDDLLEPVFVD